MNIERKLKIVIIALVLTLTLAACGSGLVLTPSEQPPGGDILPTSGDLDIIITPPAGQQPAGNDIIITPPAGQQPDIIINKFPDEYLIFQGYLEAINARPAGADFSEIEGTIISITHSEVCPYQEETCSIEPYPNDWGIVRVDRVLSHSAFSGGNNEPIIEQPAEGDEGEVTSTSGSQGQDISPKESVFSTLAEGQEVTTQFVLTSRPVIVRYVPGEKTVPFDGSSNLEGGGEDTIEQPAQPGDIVYKQLPQDDGVLIFTTQVGEVKEEVLNKLPGLEVGTRFRAMIRYDGILYINEYEIIP
jgi:hypothetical protein